ncbi:hypothetical protein F6476_16800 [Pseudomonas umsongensis]|jgi:hypothetical protein|uniref:hypothetical protein n=1 Tax=Pseudomonas umsongensis TaxID=198618 RepID=UPI0012485E69|nr:hypothetical protein [Pseudomonas umsongensis]MDP9690474.1 hypothetical protein [Pseudomonas mohnii]QFG30710.1 hypothetical protein F6476_16800 [Pseudomonas umsongensis]
MKRRRITEDDAATFINILKSWDINKDGELNWNSFIASIQAITGYLYERTSLYKTKEGAIYREFETAKTLIRTGTKPKGNSMSRKNLLVAHSKLKGEIETLRAENLSLLQLHARYLKLLYENDIIPEFDEL